MKKLLSIILVMMMLLQVTAFAKTVPAPGVATFEKDFTTVDATYDTSANGWLEQLTPETGKGLITQTNNTTPATLTWNGADLGDSFSVEGSIDLNYNPSWNAASQHVKVYVKEGLYFQFAWANNAGETQRMIGLYSDSNTNTPLGNYVQAGGASNDFNFKIEVAGGKLSASYSINDNGPGTLTQLITDYDISSYTTNKLQIMCNFRAEHIEYIKIQKMIEIGQLGIMAEIASYGAKTTNGINLNFTAPIAKDTLASALSLSNGSVDTANIVLSNNDKTALVPITVTDEAQPCTLTVAGDFTSVNGDWMGTNEGDNTPFTYTFNVNNKDSEVDAEGIVNTSFALDAAASADKLYDGNLFIGNYYYTGAITLNGESYVYFNATNNGTATSGYRAKIVPGASSAVLIEKLTDGVVESVACSGTSINKLKANDNVKFAVEVNASGTVNVSVIGDGAMITATATGLTFTERGVGVGSSATKSNFAGLNVAAAKKDIYKGLSLVGASPEFVSYVTYDVNDTIELMVQVEASADAIVGSPTYKVDGVDAGFLVKDDVSSTSTVQIYKASVTGLTEGLHKLSASFTDAINKVTTFESKEFLVLANAKDTATTTGFKFNSDGKNVPALANARNKTVDIEFTSNAAEYAIVVCLFDASGNMEASKSGVYNAATSTISFDVPDKDLTGYSLNALVVNGIYSSTPISGIVELK